MGNSDNKTGKSGGYPTPDALSWRPDYAGLGQASLATNPETGPEGEK
jgi:hypothetical protein